VKLPIRVRAVILDWDGTLLDSYRADARAYQFMFRALRIKFSSRDLARHYSPDWYRVYRAAKIPRSQWQLADKLWSEKTQCGTSTRAGDERRPRKSSPPA
jgi:beta-phosphoglucomutase-like phosphatase (HAD superfamily)